MKAASRGSRRRLALASAAAVVAMLATACGSQGSGSQGSGGQTGTAAAPSQKLVFSPGSSTPTAKFVPLYYAQDKGIFKKYGLDIDVKLLSPSAAIAAIVGGSVDMAGAGEGVITAMAKEGSGKIVGTTGYVRLQLWTSTKLTTAADLKGKVVAAGSSPGGTIDAATKGYLASKNLTGSVKLVYLGSVASELTALKSGAVAAAVLSPPSTVEAAADASIHSIGDVSRDARPTPLSVNGEFYANHRQLVKEFIEARKDAIDDIRNDIPGAVKAFMNHNPNVDQATAQESIKQYLDEYAIQPYSDSDAAAVLASDPSTKSVKASTIVDNSLVNQVGGVGAT